MKWIVIRWRNNNQQWPWWNVNVVDNLLSESSTDALSARQGKRLDEKKQEKITWWDTWQVLTKLTDEDWEFEWKTPQSWSGGTVWRTFTTNVAIWWVPVWTTINATDDIWEILQRMFVTYIAPSISASITPATSLYKKWTSVNITQFRAVATKNSKPITKIEFKQGPTILETLTSWVENWWTFTYSWTISAITTDTTFIASVTDGDQTKTSSKSIEFIVPFYWGSSDNATVDSIAWFTEDLSKKSNKTYTYNLANQYITIIYDSSYWQLTSIKDQNWFEWISWYDTWTFTENWQTYRYYVSQLKVTDSSAKFTFTF